MKIIFREVTYKKIREITGKELKNVSIYHNEKFLADLNQSIEIDMGTYNVSVKVEYTDGSVDILENQPLVVKDKDVLKTINYSGIKAAAKAYTTNYLFWIGVALTLLTGIGVIFLIIGLLVTDKSKPYQKEGISMMKLF